MPYVRIETKPVSADRKKELAKAIAKDIGAAMIGVSPDEVNLKNAARGLTLLVNEYSEENVMYDSNLPYVVIEVTPLTDDKREAMTKAITADIGRILDVPCKKVCIVFHENLLEKVMIGGIPFSEIIK